MKSITRSIAVISIFVALAMPTAALKAGEDNKSLIFAAAQSTSQKHMKACRARYRDCIRLNQIPSFECQFVYNDCVNHIY